MPHGKEIYIFFGQYKLCGLIGIIISTSTIGILISRVLKIIYKTEKIQNYNDFIKYIFNNKNSKIDLATNINLIINIFLLISFYIMTAGFASYFKQQYNIPGYIALIAISILSYIALSRNIEGVIKISVVFVPIIILFVLRVGTVNIEFGIEEICNMEFSKDGFLKGIISSILYASYNSILLIPVVISLKKYAKKDNICLIGILISIILFVLAFLVYIILLKGNVNIMQLDMPLVYLIKDFGKVYEYLYGIVIVISIYTSIISAGYSFLRNCSKNEKEYKKHLIMMCISSIFIANLGFSKLVNLLYPIFGVLGIVQIYYILKIKI